MLRWIGSFEPDDVFYDIGANVGGVTFTVAGLHANGLRMVAIEPSFSSFEALARNLSLNGLLGSTIPLQVALLDQTGLQPLNYRSTAAGVSLHAVGAAVDHEGAEFTPVEVQLVPTYRLDDLIETLGLPEPTVVKIDVDGYEELVLRGAINTLTAGSIRELNVEVVDHDRAGTRLRAITELLGGAGYEAAGAFRHGPEDGFVADHLFRRRADTRPSEPEPRERSDAPEGTPVEDGARRAGAPTPRGKNTLLAERYRLLSQEVSELRGSYYLSGAGKKADLRQLPGFSELARRVMEEGRSGMNYDRLYVLWQAVRGTRSDLPLAEVGAYRGGSARFISQTLRHDGRAARFYVCDTFAGHARTDPDIDTRHHGLRRFEDTSAEEVAAYLEDDLGIELIVGDIVETSEQLAGERFSFVHLDLDVYHATAFCLRFFATRLADDAVILVDDYGVVTCPGVQKATDEFVATTDGFRLFHLLSGQAILYKVS